MKKTESNKCLSCQFVSGELVSPGGIILETKYWSCDHAFDVPLPGFLILKTNRHTESITKLTADEARELGLLLLKITKVIDTVLKPERIYVLRFGEVVRHVHFWLLPRTKEVLENCGKGPESVRTIVNFYRNNFSMKEREKEILNIIKELREALNV